MSGEANEFLYFAENLSKTLLQHLNTSNSDLNTIVDESIFHGSIMFILGVFITSIITLYVLKKLIFPIQKVTQVFDILASNKELHEQLDVNRSDEIGQLMKSATIFQQTNILLI
jgi:methyl-accepting chemotaxis protein